jgi:hypothetical protein
MKIIEHSNNNLVLKDSAGCMWPLGLFFLSVAGLFAAGLSGLFTNLDEFTLLEKSIAWFISLSGIAAGIWIIYSHPFVNINFDKNEDAVIITRKRITGKEIESYPLNEIKDIIIIEDTDTDGDKVYGFGMKLISGKVINLTNTIIQNKDLMNDDVDVLKNFLNLK